MEAGVGTGLIFRVSIQTGNVLWKKKFGGAASGRAYIFQQGLYHNNSFKVATLVKEGAGPFKIAMISVRQGGETEGDLLIDIPSMTLQQTAKVAVDLQYDVVSFTAGENEPNVYLAKMTPWNYSGSATGWAKKYSIAGIHKYLHTDRCFDGGFIIAKDATNAAGETFTRFLKTDSTGSIKNCEGTAVVLNASIVMQPSIEESAATNTLGFQLQNETPNIADHNINHSFNCKNLNCPVLPAENACLSSFTRLYGTGALADIFTTLLPFATENIVAGQTNPISSFSSAQSHATLSRLTAAGKIIDRKKMQFGNNTGFTHLSKLADGNFIALGNARYPSGISLRDTSYVFVAKFSPTLQLIWHTAFPKNSSYSAEYGIQESSDGSIFINFVEGDAFYESPKLLKLNSQGQLVWLKKYAIAGSCVIGYNGSFTQDADYIYLLNFGSCNAGNIFMKIDKTTGTSLITKGFNFSAGNNVQWQGASNMQVMGDKLVLQGYYSSSYAQRDISYILDKDGNVLRMKAITTAADGAFYFKQKVLQNKEIVLLASSWLPQASYFIRMDSNLNIIRSRQTAISAMGFKAMAEDNNGALIAVSNRSSADPYAATVAFTRFDYDGRMGSCFSDSLIVQTVDMNFITTPLTAIANDFPISFTALPFKASSYSMQDAGILCSEASNCNNIQLTAPAAVCDTLVHVTVARRNAGCALPVSFTAFNNPGFVITERTDSSIKFKILQAGTSMLVASIFTGCNWVRDTVYITSTSVDVSLGADTSICINSSLVLDAGPGFASYEWSDGSALQQLSINSPGMYFVKVRDGCGNSLSDTINISPVQVPTLNLGNDTSTCNATAILLTATPGFISYQWLPSYRLTALSNHVVSVAPAVDTAYSVRVEYAAGCFTYDTIKIKVNYSAPVSLGADKSFCAGDSVLLNAGVGFVNYAWNTGASSQVIAARSAGSYSVTATDINGCQSKDTMLVANVYANPGVQLGNDFSLCNGSVRNLNAGNFSSYLWNNGSTGQTLAVNSPGTYFVTVTDAQSCKGSDTVRLNMLWPVPQNFLPTDTAICNYGSLTLTSINAYQNYLWSNNSNARSINITAPGKYWLSVTDGNGCNGKDTLTVLPKQCMQGFYIPTAFTPNTDGTNDDFKPLIFGDLEQYTFQVYNRYGQVIFVSKEHGKGWDGRFLSAAQNSGAFVWVCVYKLKNETAKTEKGSVLLIR